MPDLCLSPNRINFWHQSVKDALVSLVIDHHAVVNSNVLFLLVIVEEMNKFLTFNRALFVVIAGCYRLLVNGIGVGVV